MARIGRSRPASNYKLVRPVTLQELNARSVSLPTVNLALAAPSPTILFGATVTLTAPNLALAAPLTLPLVGAVLTTPNLQLAALPILTYQSTALAPSPIIPVPIAGFGYEQADFIELWSDAAAFFQQRVVFRATQVTTATTLPSAGTLTSIIFDNITEDPYDGWALTSASTWTAPVAGWYQATVTAWVAAPGATNTVLEVYVQTVKSPGNAANSKALTAVVVPNAVAGAEATWTVYLAVGDAMSGAASIQNSGSPVLTSLTAGQNSSMEIIWISS